MALVKNFKKGKANVFVYENDVSMGQGAADKVEEIILGIIDKQDEVNLVCSIGSSQHTFLTALMAKTSFDWGKINFFHVDEKVGLAGDDFRSGQVRLKEYIDKVKYKAAYFFDGMAPDPEVECERYSKLMEEHKPDIAFIGIGINGHMAFNEPGQGKFDDTMDCKLCLLSDMTKKMNVDNGCFKDIASVPNVGLTITLPGLLKAKYKVCAVPYAEKENSAYEAMYGPITEELPASIIRTADNAFLYFDTESAGRFEMKDFF